MIDKPKRLSLINYDVLRELCERCANEKFQFVPTGSDAEAGHCSRCGASTKMADLSDSSILRLVMRDGEAFVVSRRMSA